VKSVCTHHAPATCPCPASRPYSDPFASDRGLLNQRAADPAGPYADVCSAWHPPLTTGLPARNMALCCDATPARDTFRNQTQPNELFSLTFSTDRFRSCRAYHSSEGVPERPN